MNQIQLVPENKDVLNKMMLLYPSPAETKTYHPINHADLISSVLNNIKRDFVSGEAQFDRTGQKMVAKLRYAIPNLPEFLYTVAVGNSYNKTMPVKLASGLSVMACLNMQVHGDINYFRKHTPLVWDGIIPAIASINDNIDEDIEKGYYDSKYMQSIKLQDRNAWKILGTMYGKKIINNKVMNTGYREWEAPSFDGLEDKTMWRLYNGLTYGMQDASPIHALEMQKNVHDYFVGAKA